MAFDAIIRHWPDLPSFVAYLTTVPRPVWCAGLTVHNTYRPDERTWAGAESMAAMLRHYRDTNKWGAGPQLFLAAEAPHPDDRGIWQLTPITHVGIHAGDCNDDHLGIECVGDFQARKPTPVQYGLLLDVCEALLRAWRLEPARVNVHRECMPGRTCPGQHFDAPELRAALTKRLAEPLIYRSRGVPIYQAKELTGTIAGYLDKDETIAIDATYSNGAGHDALHRGFVRLSDLERVS